jgi:hypothetical protein
MTRSPVRSDLEEGGNTLYHSSNLQRDRESGTDYYPPSGQKILILTVKDILHSFYGLVLHVGEDVRVGVEGYELSRAFP